MVNFRYQEGPGTNTSLALIAARNRLYTPQEGDRLQVRDIAVVISDGFSGKPESTVIEAKRLHGAGIRTFAIGIGKSVSQVITTSFFYFIFPNIQPMYE